MSPTRIRLKSISAAAPYLMPLLSTLLIYIVFVYLLTLNPFHFSMVYFKQFIQFKKGLLVAFIGGASIDDIILNLFMLFPPGLIIGSLLRVHGYKRKQSIALATAIGFVISFSIEFCQAFLSRSTSGIDILTNTLGSALGARLAYPIRGFDSQQILNHIYRKGSFFYSRLIIIYSVLATLVFLIPVLLNSFNSWDSSYHFLIGNEATLNRPWNGVIYKLSVFNRKLKRKEIQKLYTSNFDQKTPTESSQGLLVEYVFKNFRIEKSGSTVDSISLFPPPDGTSYFSEQYGLSVTGNSLIRSQKPATKLINLLRRSNQLSIAIWLQPENLSQDGPARIVSISQDTDNRNFTLGQSGSRLNFRVRTGLTGANGSKVELTTQPLLELDKAQFIVATFHRGESKIFFNGKMTSPIITDTSYYLPLLLGLSKYYFGRMAFCLMLLFPLGWLSRGLVVSKFIKSSVSSLVVMIPFFISSSIKILVLNHSVDLHLFFICGTMSILIFIFGILYDLFLTR